MGMGTLLRVSFNYNRQVIRICGPVTYNGERYTDAHRQRRVGGNSPTPVIVDSLETWDSSGLFCPKYCSDKQVFGILLRGKGLLLFLQLYLFLYVSLSNCSLVLLT